MDEALNLGIVVAFLILTSFVLGATVMFVLESKRPRPAPLWLIVAKNLIWTAWVGYAFLAWEAPSGIVTIDPGWWAAIGGATLIASLVAFGLEVRAAVRVR
jgi:hypothetical protein